MVCVPVTSAAANWLGGRVKGVRVDWTDAKRDRIKYLLELEYEHWLSGEWIVLEKTEVVGSVRYGYFIGAYAYRGRVLRCSVRPVCFDCQVGEKVYTNELPE